jgi:hypothetical protein
LFALAAAPRWRGSRRKGAPSKLAARSSTPPALRPRTCGRYLPAGSRAARDLRRCRARALPPAPPRAPRRLCVTAARRMAPLLVTAWRVDPGCGTPARTVLATRPHAEVPREPPQAWSVACRGMPYASIPPSARKRACWRNTRVGHRCRLDHHGVRRHRREPGERLSGLRLGEGSHLSASADEAASVWGVQLSARPSTDRCFGQAGAAAASLLECARPTTEEDRVLGIQFHRWEVLADRRYPSLTRARRPSGRRAARRSRPPEAPQRRPGQGPPRVSERSEGLRALRATMEIGAVWALRRRDGGRATRGDLCARDGTSELGGRDVGAVKGRTG